MAFLAFGSFWFWVIFVIASVFILAAAEKGSGIWASVTMVVTIALLFFFGNGVSFGNFFQYCMDHPWITVGAVVGYLILGVCWSILKWYFFLIKERDRVLEEKPAYIRVPQISSHKSEVTVWMIYWPYSAVWTLLDVPVKKAYMFIYYRIAGALQNMANKIFEPIQKKIEQEEKARRGRL